MRCTAKRKDGERCERPAGPRKVLCPAHVRWKVGRPSALTPEVHDRLVQAVKAGAPNRIAALSAGISESTLYELLSRGREEDSGPRRELHEAIERARGEAYLHAMASWRRDMHTPGNWRASMAWIDRFDRGRFSGQGSAAEAAGPGGSQAGGPKAAEQRLDLSALGDEQIAYLEALYSDDDPEEREAP